VCVCVCVCVCAWQRGAASGSFSNEAFLRWQAAWFNPAVTATVGPLCVLSCSVYSTLHCSVIMWSSYRPHYASCPSTSQDVKNLHSNVRHVYLRPADQAPTLLRRRLQDGRGLEFPSITQPVATGRMDAYHVGADIFACLATLSVQSFRY